MPPTIRLKHLLSAAAAMVVTTGFAAAQDPPAAAPPGEPAPVAPMEPAPAAPAEGAAPAEPAPAAPAAEAIEAQQANLRLFVAEAYNALIFKASAAQLAMERAQSEEVRALAERVIDGQDDAIAQLEGAANAANLGDAFPDRVSEEQQQFLTELAEAPTDAFDEMFLEQLVVIHQRLEPSYQRIVQAPGDVADELRVFAENRLALETQLQQETRDIAGQLGIEIADAGPGVGAEPGMPAAGAEGAAGAAAVDGAVEGRLVVEQAAPAVQIQQGETRVFVTQAQPEVTVMQDPPQIIVRQAPPIIRIEIPEPLVTVDMPEPEIIVRMPEANVAFNTADPQIRIEQAQPIVEVIQAEPEVALEVAPGGAGPRAAQVQANAPTPVVEMGERPEPAVNLQRGEPQVAFEAADPQVVFAPPGEPQVQINRVGELNVQVEDVAPGEAPAGEPAPAPAGDAALPPAGEAAPAAPPEPAPAAPAGDMADAEAGTELTVAEIVDLPLVNASGDELGDIEQVGLLDNRLYLVVGRGGLLGIGEQKVALPLDAMQFNGEALVLPNVTNEQLDGMEEIDLNDFTVLEADERVQLAALP